MAVPTPAMNPPRLPSPSKRNLHNRSPSRSPVGQHRARDTDSLLRDLSPSATLRAFSTSTPDQFTRDGKGIETATHAQRVLGAKAAQAGLDLRMWVRELEEWDWPETFEVPEPARKKQRMSSMSVLSDVSKPSTMQVEEEAEGYWGSLPANTAQAYEERIERINEDLDEIDVEEMKDFILSAHNQAGFGEASIDDSIGTIGADTNFRRLDDFTALITATILQALPYLSRLSRLLHTWALRLSILRAAPKYLRDLAQARTDLDHGWAALAVSKHPAAADAMRKANAAFTFETMQEMKTVVERQVYSLGKRLDEFLDMLEGREECVPDGWIEEFEVLEKQYGVWVVQAERKVLKGEWSLKEEEEDSRNRLQRSAGPEDRGVVTLDAFAGAEADESDIRPQTASTITGPTTTTTTSGRGLKSPMNTSTHTSTTGPSTTTVTTISPTLSTAPRQSDGEPSSGSRHSSPSRRSRHIPIVIEGFSDGSPQKPAELPVSTNKTMPLPPMPTQESGRDIQTASQKVKKRAAFLNGEIEKGDGLIKSKSPPIVRPFEHASNAFTRLFKRDQQNRAENEEAVSRNGSAASLGSGKRSSSRKRREKEKDAVSEKNSQISGNSSGSKARSSQFSGGSLRPESGRRSLDSRPMKGYGDMIFVAPTSSDGSGSKKSKSSSTRDSGTHSLKKAEARRMEYGDMVRMPERKLDESGSGRSRERSMSTPKKDKKVRNVQSLEYGDLVRIPELLRPEDQRRAAPKDDLGIVPEMRTSPQSKRTSKQNITALPRFPSDAELERTLTPTKRAPETYRPTGLNSPFHSPTEPEQAFDIPEDWPLSSSHTPRDTPSPMKVVQDADEETGDESGTDLPIQNFETDYFDNTFVRSIPSSPAKRDMPSERKVDERRVLIEEDSPRLQRSAAPLQDESEGVVVKSATDRSWMRTGVNRVSRRLDLTDSSWARPVSMVQEADEEHADDERTTMNSDAEGEEYGIKDTVNAAGYFGGGGGGAKTPCIAPARLSSSRTVVSSGHSPSTPRVKSTPPVSPGLTRLRIPTSSPQDPEPEFAPFAFDQVQEPRAGVVRRASATSIEAHPRSDLKSIDVVRRSSMDSAPQTPKTSSSPLNAMGRRHSTSATRTPTSPLSYKEGTTLPSLPSVPPRGSSLQNSPEGKRPDEAGELNATMSKQRKYKDVPKNSRPGSAKKSLPLQPGEDNFDRYVSEVLNRVHAPIKFKSRPGAVTPQAEKAAFGAKLPKARERMGLMKNMTLAPAESSPRKATPADPEVKLYHLTQAGRSEPIKLYVRLVGEGERVMVRVGGGWADLADDLRQYAEHHGSRTVSESVLELQTAGVSPASLNGPAGKRTFSGPAEPKARTPITPSSSGFSTLERPRTRDSERLWLGIDQPRFTMGDSDEELGPTFYSAQRSTPKSTTSGGSRPSTAHSLSNEGLLGAENSLPAAAVGLAGPPGKMKADLPEQKARWVEGMIQQVNKSASAEKSREEREKYFGDMGHVGGTRRVVFRSSSGAAG